MRGTCTVALTLCALADRAEPLADRVVADGVRAAQTSLSDEVGDQPPRDPDELERAEAKTTDIDKPHAWGRTNPRGHGVR